MLAGSCRTPVLPCCYPHLCLPVQVPPVQLSPFCGGSATNYPVQLIGMAENLMSVVKTYKVSRLSKPWWRTRADAAKAVGEGSEGQERAGLLPLTW